MRAGAVLFDLDGVLVDSRASFVRWLGAALAERGHAAPAERELERFLGPPLHHAVERLLGAHGAATPSEVDAVAGAYRARARERGPREIAAFPGVADMLARLAERGLPMAVATSKPQALAVPLLEANGLAGRFAGIVGPSLEARHESKAETIERALGHLDGAGPVVMVGDRRHDVEGAAAHGLPCVGVLWGVGDERELRDAGAVALAAAPAELPALLGAA